MKTVDLDNLIDIASEYRRHKDRIWPMHSQVDWESGLHGENSVFNLDESIRAARPWRTFTALIDNGVVRLTNVPRSRQRGFVRIPDVAVSLEYLDPDRVFNQFLIAWQKTEWFVVAQRWNRLLRPERDDIRSVQARMAFGHAIWSEYVWRATFSLPNHAPFVIPTDARGALSLFKLRDRPDDGRRRPALHHWVNEHFRGSKESDREVPVREHLRGKQVFSWSGISVQLEPSPFDAERARLATCPVRRK